MQKVCWFSATVLVLAGCSSPPPAAAPMVEPAMTTALPTSIVTPVETVGGRVALANMQARYVVITFPIGILPPVNQQFSLYRDGLRVGEIRITGPRRDNSTIADIVTGEARVGDEVR